MLHIFDGRELVIKYNMILGLTLPEEGLNMSAALSESRGTNANTYPYLGSHFGKLGTPDKCSLLSRTYIGQNNV